MGDESSYRGVVQKVIGSGRHGPYAVATSEDLGSITFSLEAPVWQEEDWPEPGMYVVLSQIRKKRSGWRALRCRFLQPTDEQPDGLNQQTENSRKQKQGAKK